MLSMGNGLVAPTLRHDVYELFLAMNAKLFVYAFHVRPNGIVGYEQSFARLRHRIPARQQVDNLNFPRRQPMPLLHPFKARTARIQDLDRLRQSRRFFCHGKKGGAPDENNRHGKRKRNSNQAAGTKINLREQSVKGGFRKRSRI